MKKTKKTENSEPDRYYSLYEAILELDTPEQVESFIRDLCTPLEVRNFNERWLAVQMLNEGEFSYREIAATLGVSTTTIGRVARFLNEEPYQGYKTVLEKLGKKNEQ